MTKAYKNWLGLVVTIIIPAIILTKFSGGRLGPLGALLLALAWPLAWGCYEFYLAKKANFLAIVGVVGVLLTGGIGLLQLNVRWLAAKEAAIPTIIALAIILLAKTKYSLVQTALQQIVDTDQIQAKLNSVKAKEGYQKIMARVTHLMAASFLLSAILNFILATVLVTSPSGTEEFNRELARLTLVSYPVIVFPSMVVLVGAMVYFINQTSKQTGLTVEEILGKV
ncbi:MAG: hypothetical protein A3E37_03540 [Candidatus Andersenbacteria bacterium RIFCSPHIGHO2_12_FULL_46_9]|nr:MAG: hypothetical protein UW94_C0014G0039 [Parcubacteria group bacterium GW2011_GWA2_45_14]OGY34095.1 MAG: hypothetical protein A3B76_04370 [Candidatus Andersenbacteria bacterium RIFCSPHIGHO2_02_FULL_46_16]OGY35327.1 MAG: hypothetical protein A3E37_03540 [Candidatus Andersenbacteria bacterium RIFCSPHIGHO2_12_FULL_46_9]OGY36073.1 MAG: hypothetical protein A3I08_03500 [Candidatus Andersenbacteria bacterium RIFCSPLOWO2_02_FULL_46_11]HBE90014.1 MFS transporter [Candidatus Andersenbacteria bacter